MKKVYAVKPKTEIELQFENGKSIVIVFDARAVAHFTEFGGLETLADTSNYVDICSMIIYAGAVENNNDFTMDNAKTIVSQLDMDTIINIINDFTDSIGTAKKEEIQQMQKKQMSQFQAQKMSR